MKRPSTPLDTRRKAVWGPGRTSAAAALLFLGLTTSAMAEGQHSRSVPNATPGVPTAAAHGYKLDEEVTERAHHGHPLGRTSVIVTLVPGAALPRELERFARKDILDIINA